MTGTKQLFSLFFLLLCSALIAACGGRGDDDDDDNGGSCSSAGQAMCARACECQPGDGCGFTDEAGAGSISFNNEQDCLALFVTLGCSGGGDAAMDYGACEDAVNAADCAGDGDTAGVVSPPECDNPND